jgi:hypothetical protein
MICRFEIAARLYGDMPGIIAGWKHLAEQAALTRRLCHIERAASFSYAGYDDVLLGATEE